LIYVNYTMVHRSTNIKFTNAKQAVEVYAYKNIKCKLYKTYTAIRFNKTCREKELTPNFINIRINGNNQQCNNTLKATFHYRLNHGIKFLYIKKQKLNEQLYEYHLKFEVCHPRCVLDTMDLGIF
jgi:hypothetical protein